jgi:hypothetical protein
MDSWNIVADISKQLPSYIRALDAVVSGSVKLDERWKANRMFPNARRPAILSDISAFPTRELSLEAFQKSGTHLHRFDAELTEEFRNP